MTHLIFVYGTLKQGYHNHRLLSGSQFVGAALTMPKYRLYDCGAFPMMVEAEFGNGTKVYGEVYMVSDAVLADMDQLEGHPYHYRREEVAIEYMDGCSGKPYVEAYIYQRDTNGLHPVVGGEWCGDRRWDAAAECAEAEEDFEECEICGMLDRKHISAIAHSTQIVLKTFRAFMDATADGTDNPLGNDRYFALECSLGELRRCLDRAGCFNLRHKLFLTAEQTTAYAALRTLADLVGENPQAPFTASDSPQGSPLAATALDPRKREASALKLASIVAALDDFCKRPSLREPVLAVLTKQQQAIMQHRDDFAECGCDYEG